MLENLKIQNKFLLIVHSEKEAVCKIPFLPRLKISTNNMALACAG